MFIKFDVNIIMFKHQDFSDMLNVNCTIIISLIWTHLLSNMIFQKNHFQTFLLNF